jgi:transcriptional regulator with AAA-type ATPase domain
LSREARYANSMSLPAGAESRGRQVCIPMATTTHPSANTTQSAARRRPNAVRWVFPRTAGTELVEQQVVGRDADCDTVLDGTEISRRHAAFRVDGPVVAVRDLESRNGVFVNARRIADAPLDCGDVIRCGEWIGVVVHANASDPDFHELAPGWWGGAALALTVEPLRRVGADLAIVIQGETGTGKEGMARALHLWSGRQGPFVAVNCAALPAHLAEAELFGFRKGAFTGADAASPGLFRAAEGGTLFLDEIPDLPPAVQPKLLRVLEERRVRALGETRDVPVDLRIIAATQEPLAEAVAERRFRPDLHARLDGVTVLLPPLRERREDVVPLFFSFMRQYGGARSPKVDAKVIEALAVYDWPLNVRELNLVARQLLSLHGQEPMLKKGHLPDRIRSLRAEPASLAGAEPSPTTAESGFTPARRKTDDEAEFDALLAALRAHGGSVAKAAAALGVGRSRAYRVLAAHPEFSLDGKRR